MLVSFNIHPSDDCLRKLFTRYDIDQDGLVERDEFEQAVLNGVLPKRKAPQWAKNTDRSHTSQGFRSRNPQEMQNDMLEQQRNKLESQAHETLQLLQQAKAVNNRVLRMQETLEGRRSSRSRLSSRASHRSGSRLGSRRAATPGPHSSLQPLDIQGMSMNTP